jgi:hypothetical protein
MVLEEQVDLLKYWRSPAGQRYAQLWIESKIGEGEGHSYFDQGWDGNYLADVEAYRLDRASTYWVSKAMCELTEQAAKKLQPEALHETSLPTLSGFVWFDQLVHSLDINLQYVNCRAVMWSPTTVRYAPGNVEMPGIMLSFYSDTRDIGKDEMLARYPKRAEQGMPKLVLMHSEPWVFGEDWSKHEDAARQAAGEILGEEAPEDWVSSMAYMSRFMFTMWKLIQMPIAVRGVDRPDRASARRMERSGVLLKEQEVRVVTLRKTRPHKTDSEEGDQDAVEWSHRWLVDSHWRWQWYPSRNRHEQILISPYIKGPEDKPLVLKDKVYAWRR